ncbi:MAG TPA: ribose-5-phosphate isomerase RpiA [Candidatus Norongarragalinales archaeon]|nr:ribose-5-phosphate isomerase RpiA [Candidatus Norongarragalinales archaeon]
MGAKENAAAGALEFIGDKQTIGLGTGSTAAIFIKLLAEKARAENLELKCIPTSLASKALAYQYGLSLIEPEEVKRIDVAVDGADLIDPKLNLIKGGGGAHAREKVIDYFADKFIVIADGSKLAKKLKGTVPLEILKFAFPFVERLLKDKYKARIEIRRRPNGDAWISDNGNYIADANFRNIPNPRRLEEELDSIPGVVANGIFSRNVSVAVVGYDKKVRVLRK